MAALAHFTVTPPILRPPTLTLFCGPPGSGKTTVARQLEREGHGVRLCTDEWQERLSARPLDEGFHGRLQSLLYSHALELLDHGVDVILEDGLWLRDERNQKFRDARAHGARIAWHVFDLTLDQLWQRVRQRNATAGPHGLVLDHEHVAWAHGLFEPPTDAELAQVDEVTHHRFG